jgi:c-di-GMP-binding flagellar brake protein YcgR
MLVSATVTFWRWLTGQPMPLLPLTSAEDSADERRVWLRHAASLNVRCGEAEDTEDAGVSAVITDISRGGMQMVAPRRFELGALVSVELPAAFDEDEMTLLACVVRSKPHGESEWMMGCRFAHELDERQLSSFGAARSRPNEPDQRGWERFPCDTKAFYQRVNGPAGPLHPARVLNIAVGGMALLVQEPIAVGDLLSTELHNGDGRPVVTILACVVHTQTVSEGQILGCNFIRELSDADVNALL